MPARIAYLATMARTAAWSPAAKRSGGGRYSGRSIAPSLHRGPILRTGSATATFLVLVHRTISSRKRLLGNVLRTLNLQAQNASLMSSVARGAADTMQSCKAALPP